MTERKLSTRDSTPASVDSVEYWFAAYATLSPQGPGHVSQWLGVPLSFASLTGLLWTLPPLASVGESGSVLNWATFFLMATVVYYFILSLRLAFGTLPFVIAFAVLAGWAERTVTPLAPVCAAILVTAEVWRLVTASRLSGRLDILGHLQHFVIAPLWLLAAAYRRLGIRY